MTCRPDLAHGVIGAGFLHASAGTSPMLQQGEDVAAGASLKPQWEAAGDRSEQPTTSDLSWVILAHSLKTLAAPGYLEN